MRSGWALVVAVAVVGCSDTASGDPDAGPAQIEPQGSLAASDLVINEVSPRPGSGPDWIEITNRSDQPLDLCGFFLTDALDRLDHYLALGGPAPPDACEPRLLEPSAYLVVYADDDAELGVDHAPFELSVADEVNLVTTTGIPVDSLVYLFPSGFDGHSLARAPDGQGAFWLAIPSRGEPNPPLEEESR